jgi:hypothetical protein
MCVAPSPEVSRVPQNFFFIRIAFYHMNPPSKINPETIKKHLDNINRKLNVKSRRQAVEKAGALGILSAH